MRVLSLCDGISGGYMALKKLGVEFEYYAIEFDKFPRTLSDDNFKDIIRPCHDVNDITEKNIIEEWPQFDLIMFGSPCQSVSVAGNGEGLNGKSGLLIKCMEVLNWCKIRNPEIKFLIENVKMKKEFLNQCNAIIGCEPTLINASLVSAQSRQRYYWTGKQISQPEDKGIFIKDILEDDSFSEKEKSYCIDSCYHKGTDAENYLEKGRRQIVFKYSESNRYEKEDGSKTQIASEATKRTVEKRMIESDKSLTLTTGDGCRSGMKSINLVMQINPDKSCGGKQSKMQDRIYDTNGKSVTMTSFCSRTNIKDGELTYRKLTVRECARLQTIPESFSFKSVSKTQAYKAIGNGWCIDVIAHILKEIL